MISNNLKSYILILREEKRAKPLKELLINNGLNVIIEPIFKICPIKYKTIDPKEYQVLLLTSVNSVKILAKEKIKTIKTYCVGKITENYALKTGFNCIRTKAKSGQTLADEVIKNVKPNNKKILIAGAKILAYDPIPAFGNANLNAERIILYKKNPSKKLSPNCSELFKNHNISNIVIYSPETAKIFLSLIKKYETKNIHVTCLGLKTKKILEIYNWKKIQVINNIELKSFANNIIKSNIL
jgi:uroporphyrinogen-III synthase